MSGGGSSGSSDSAFERKGTATTTSFRELTPEHTALFRQGISATAPITANSSVDSMLTNRIRGQVESRPYRNEVYSLLGSNLPNQQSPGENALRTQAGQDVYSGDYAANTYNRYAEEVQKAMGAARSGPAMTRGGTAAQGFAQAQAVNDLGMNREAVLAQNRSTDAQIGQNAANTLSQNRHAMNTDAVSAIGAGQQGYGQFLQNMMSAGGLASERTKMFNDLVPTFATLGSRMIGTEDNDLYGKGGQTSSSVGGGINLCCFIFLEAYYGEMPWWVRKCRDEFAPESSSRRRGYVKMSRWLVPAMRISGIARRLTNYLLIAPLTKWGAWHKGVTSTPEPRFCRVVKNAWFKFWELTGN